MAGQHGSRRYYQVLLQPNRAALVEELAKEKGIRSTEMIRQMVYSWLERELPASQYKQALGCGSGGLGAGGAESCRRSGEK